METYGPPCSFQFTVTTLRLTRKFHWDSKPYTLSTRNS